jgi:predicted ribosome quality control (RQC) complex YloA/Tae2 family protein
MAYDGFLVNRLATELHDLLKGRRIDKVFQPEHDEIQLSIRGIKKERLLITINGTFPRIHMTTYSKPNPAKPPMFCMLMRKLLGGAQIESIEQVGFDRIIRINCIRKTELYDHEKLSLIIEMMGKHSNCMLVDHENRVIEVLKRVSSDMSSVRQVMPNLLYTLPPNKKASPFDLVTAEAFQEIRPDSLSRSYFQLVSGTSYDIADEFEWRAINNHAQTPDDYLAVHLSLVQELTESARPLLYNSDPEQKQKRTVSALTLTHRKDEPLSFPSFSLLIDDFFYSQDKAQRTHQKTSDLAKLLSQKVHGLEKKIEKLHAEQDNAQKRDIYQKYGELLMANLYTKQTSRDSIVVVDYYTEDQSTLEIPLNDQWSLQRNAQHYFKRYQKLKAAMIHTEEQMEIATREKDYLETVLTALESVETEDDIEGIRFELQENGILRKRHTKKQKKIQHIPLRYKTSDGYVVLVGKNNYQNEEVTFKKADRMDWWFHITAYPGSHVILITNGDDIPDRSMEEAAMIAAYHSKARESSLVSIDYTRRKHIKKPAHSKPGMVIYHEYYSMHITPDLEKIQSLREKEK